MIAFENRSVIQILENMWNRAIFSLTAVKAAGDKLLMNTFIRQNFGGGRTLKNFIS